MTMLMMMNGLIFCLVCMWTSAATGNAPDPDFYGDESQLSIQLRRRACRNLEGRCVKNKRDCPKRLPLETQPGRPHCSRKRRCCYPDIDECKADNGGCDHICTNTKESYNCSCHDGFTLSDDQRSCTDEQLVGSSCDFDGICDDSGPVNISSCKDIEFRLYNSTKDNYDILITSNKTSVNSSSFNPSLPLLVVAHGYRENANTSTWMHEVKDKWLEKKPMNVILVQWAKLADLKDYCQAVRNTKCVGTKLANLINFLESYTGLSPSDTHIIGFSLGAQLAGVAGHQVHNLSRITGLDPAGPGFYKVDPSDRLDKEDATFVDIIHANGGCILGFSGGHFGFLPQCGHVDFYMNGGSFQNGCPTFNITDIEDCIEDILHPEKCVNFLVDNFACSHNRAHAYYVESLTTSEPSYGYQCEDYDTFQKGLCLNRPNNTIGFGVTSDPAGKFYSNTQANSTFLTRSILVQLAVGGDDETYHGKAFVGAILPNRKEETVDIMSSYDGVPSGTILTKLITVPSGTILSNTQISAKYKYDKLFFWTPNHLVANSIEAYDAYERSWYCVNGTSDLHDKTLNKFTPTLGRCKSS